MLRINTIYMTKLPCEWRLTPLAGSASGRRAHYLLWLWAVERLTPLLLYRFPGAVCVLTATAIAMSSTTGRVSAVSYTTGSSDIAENYYSEEQLEPGDIVAARGGESVGKASSTTDPIIGIISTNPGFVLGLDNDNSQENKYPVALTGKVPVKVNLEGGDIKIGTGLL